MRVVYDTHASKLDEDEGDGNNAKFVSRDYQWCTIIGRIDSVT